MGDRKMVDGKKQERTKGRDISIKFFDSFIRTMDALKKSLDVIKEKEEEMDALVNYGVGYVEDKKLTHGISMGTCNTGVYGGTDLVYNSNSGEYILLKKMGEIVRYDWTGKKVGSVFPTKKFSRILYIPQTGNYLGYNPGKSAIYILKEEFNLAIDTVAISHIDKIFYNGRITEENTFEFFIVNYDTINKYSYSPAGNAVTLQECLKVADVEAEGTYIDQVCFDEPMDDKKQWIYITFKQHCTIIDATGRSYGTKKNLHRFPITAIVAVGSSEFVVTGDSAGLLKMWGTRWTFLTEVRPHTAMCTHLIEHPNGRAVVSFSMDQSMFAWSLDSKKKLEILKAPEIIERITINRSGKSFMTLGPRKLVLWKMDELFRPVAQMSSPVFLMKNTWNPECPIRSIVVSQDNAVRLLNPISGKMLTSALVNPVKPPLNDFSYLPQLGILYVVQTPHDDLNALEIQIFDCNVNPCRLRESWSETKWGSIGVTAIALYEHIPSMLLPEKTMMFAKNKEQLYTNVMTTFLIVGMRDGTIGRMDVGTGDIDYKVLCHKGSVHGLCVNPEVSQFASIGMEPSIRIWKVFIDQDEIFVPVFEITWKFPVHHVAIVREAVCFALSHHESSNHKIVVFDAVDTERYNHRTSFGHSKEILSVSGSRELKLFCSSSMDETVRIWSDKCDLVRLLQLNWIPSYAAFGTSQGDIFVGIGNSINLIPADKYLPIIYRNRAIQKKMSLGVKELPIPLGAQRLAQDPRMYIVLEEEDKNEKERKEKEKEKDKRKFIPPSERKQEVDKDIIVPTIEPYHEPKDSQRAKDYEKRKMLEEDLKQIMEGNHQFSIYVPDFHKMTKKQLDDYGRTIFTGPEGEKRKMFASESRIAGLATMDKFMKELDNFTED